MNTLIFSKNNDRIKSIKSTDKCGLKYLVHKTRVTRHLKFHLYRRPLPLNKNVRSDCWIVLYDLDVLFDVLLLSCGLFRWWRRVFYLFCSQTYGFGTLWDTIPRIFSSFFVPLDACDLAVAISFIGAMVHGYVALLDFFEFLCPCSMLFRKSGFGSTIFKHRLCIAFYCREHYKKPYCKRIQTFHES